MLAHTGEEYISAPNVAKLSHTKKTFITLMKIHTGENHNNAATVMWHLQMGLVLNHTRGLILERSHSIVANVTRISREEVI